jgi:cohesin loading factor subunit SCC2
MIRKDHLNKLQNLLFFNIKDGRQSVRLLKEENASTDQDKLFRDILIEKILKASDCSLISLTIMTAPKISKELIIEDTIEQIATFVKVNLTETIFPHYDTTYKIATTTTTSKVQNSNAKRKLAMNSTTSTSTSTTSTGNGGLLGKAKNMQNFYNGMREILSLLAELVCSIDLTDTIIITLSSLSIMCFFVENISDMQLISLRLLTNIFTRYSKHRQLVFDDILSSLIKLHPNKRNSRSYKCFNGDSIQMFSALILQLIQSEVNVIENFHLTSGEHEKKLTFEERESFILNAYEDSNQSAKKFLSHFFAKCKAKQADFDFRPIFENFIQDLLTTVNKPEWPVSETILNLLGIILVNQIQNDQNEVSVRVNSLEYLGQIVAQLRKDSLDYQKNGDKILQCLKKINYQRQEDPVERVESKDISNFQKSLITYLDSLTSNDSSLQYSKYFLVGQWLTELNNKLKKPKNQDSSSERIQQHNLSDEARKSLLQLLEKSSQDLKTIELNPAGLLDFHEAFLLSKYLCSLNKTLDKNFDHYLTSILRLSGGMSAAEANTPTQVRSKAIKCLSSIVEADPKILLNEKVFGCVKSNFLHQTISVREASVDLIGRFITLKPELTSFYYQLLSDRILDVGVSVRKRTIKIFRDVCINQPQFERISEICVKILRRINDEDGIKKIVIDMFYSIWFAPLSNREHLMRRVLNIVDVVSEISSNGASLEVFEQLFASLTTAVTSTGQQLQEKGTTVDPDSTSNAVVANTPEQELQLYKVKEVFASCKQIVNCLIENVLNIENTSTGSSQDYKRLVASFATLHLLSKIKPENFINHAETMLPYLNIKSTNPSDNQIINSAAKILECVIPLLQSPSNSFLISLEESLCKLILNSGMMIVSSCVSCLGTVVNKLTRNYKLGADCFLRFFKLYENLKRTVKLSEPLAANVKPAVYRMLFTLGLLSKHFDVESAQFAEFKICSKNQLFDMYMFFIQSKEVDIQQKTLVGLGSFLTRYSEFMITDEVKSLYLSLIKSASCPYALKSQVFVNLTEYLREEDEHNLAKSVELSKNHGANDDLKEMLDVQSGMASTIIQSYLKPILDSYLTPKTSLRMHVFSCLSMILNQGLVYPIECVPYLVAMTTDQDKVIQSRSLIHLTNLQKAHPGFVQSKSIAGVNVSFLLQKILFKSQQQQQQQQREPASADQLPNTQSDLVIRGYFDTGEILSLNHHLYSLLRTNRAYRRAFSTQLLKMFDDSYKTAHKTSLAHMLYISDNLAYFPYQLMDEPLFIIQQIDIIISVTGINLLQTFKESLLNHRTTTITTTDQNRETNYTDPNVIKIEVVDRLDVDVDQDCPIIEEEEDQSQHKKATKLDDDDDEEETFDSVYMNLPADLKVLKDCMYKAQGCCLLIILKMFFKEVYSISDSKIQNYCPTDTAKVNDRPITSRKNNRKFNPKGIIEYMIKTERDSDEEELRMSLCKEYLEFKEMILSIDQEESRSSGNEENKPNSNLQRTAFNQNGGGGGEASKLTALQQKLCEGIEKTKGSDATPKKINRSSKNKTPVKKPSNKKRKKLKKDSDGSTDESDYNNSDYDDES